MHLHYCHSKSEHLPYQVSITWEIGIKLRTADCDSTRNVSTRPYHFYHVMYFFLRCSCTSDLYQQNLDPAVNPDQIQNWSWILCWLHVQPQDWAMWLDGELCGVVGNNNMCWPGPLHTSDLWGMQCKQQTAHSHWGFGLIPGIGTSQGLKNPGLHD